MAEEKKVPLSIILRTVDRATAGIVAVNKKLDQMTKPTREFGKALKDLGEKSGLNDVVAGFRGVGGAVADLLGKVAMVGGVVGVAVAGLLSLVDHFDQLGDTAERLGTSADFLAAFRYAAERAGAPLEGVDEALQTLVTNMGAAKAGTGKMLKFLSGISPVLARQVTAANSLEEALGLLADAEAKLPDAARRGKLAAATLGDPALAPLLAKGSKGVQELLTEFHGLAGGMGDAADAAGKTDDEIKKMHAATEGVKAALVTGLAPALTVIIGKLTTWLVDHRADVARWAEDIGKKLPGAVDDLVAAVKGVVGDVIGFVDGIGGLKAAAVIAAAVIAGPLVASVISLGIALASTPVGWIVAGIAAIAAGAYLLITRWDAVKEFFRDLWERWGGYIVVAWHVAAAPIAFFLDAAALIMGHWDGIADFFSDLWRQIIDVFESAYRVIKPIIDVVVAGAGAVRDAANFLTPGQDEQRANAVATAASEGITLDTQAAAAVAPRPQQAAVKVEFVNAPKGTRVTADPTNTAHVDLTTGHQMAGAW